MNKKVVFRNKRIRRKIIIIISNKFPLGAASARRNLHIAKAFIEAGFEVEVFIVAETEYRDSIQNKMEGRFEGVAYRYLTYSNKRSRNIAIKFFSYLFGVFNLFIRIFIQVFKYKLTIISANFTSSVFYAFIFYKFLQLLKIKLILTRDEYPQVILRQGIYTAKYRINFLNKYYKNFDGIIVITKTLGSYYKELVNDHCKFFHLPMSVDFSVFSNIVPKQFDFNYIMYGGFEDPHHDKDGVQILVSAWAKICSKYINTKLLLAGTYPEKRMLQVKSLGIEDQVVFEGLVNPNEIPGYLKGALVLALSRPANKQAEGGFSTKLGEYLASGVPAVITKVGEVGDYFSDGKNAFIAEPDDVSDFANKLDEALSNPARAAVIAKNGKTLARDVFNYKNYCSDLKVFVESL